jgi:hypothetical protein
MKNAIIGLLPYVLLLFILTACLKQNSYSAVINTNDTDSLISIRSLRKIHNNGEVEFINRDWSIEAVVVGNDESNNLYKTIAIQDSTGGILLLLDGSNLYQQYPIGSLLKIRLKNLYLSDYRRMYQLVATVDTSTGSLVTTGIPVPLFPKFLKTIKDHVEVNPLNVSFKNLTDSLQGRLIRLSNVEFAAADTSQTYSDKKNKIGASRSLKFCVGGTIYLRTSGYADFSGIKLPSGNGEVIGVYSVFNTEKQIFIRDTSDILFKGRRCTGAAWLKDLPK